MTTVIPSAISSITRPTVSRSLPLTSPLILGTTSRSMDAAAHSLFRAVRHWKAGIGRRGYRREYSLPVREWDTHDHATLAVANGRPDHGGTRDQSDVCRKWGPLPHTVRALYGG